MTSRNPLRDRPGTSVSRRRFVEAAGAAGIAGLAGCTGNSDQPAEASSGNGNGNGNGENESGVDVGEADEDDIVLEFWHIFGSELGSHLDHLVAEYNDRADGIHVETTSQGGYGENFEATMSAINAGNAPHISLFASGDTSAALDADAFIPVEDLLGDNVNWSDYMEVVVDYFAVDGTWHSMPINNSTAIMSYNRDMFEEAGLDPDEPPETMAEVRQVSETLVEETQAEEGCAWANVTWFINQWSAIDQEFVFNNANGREGDSTEILLETETARRIYSWWKEMYDDELYMATQQGWGDASGAALQSGRVGINLGSTAGLGRNAELAEEASEPFELGAAPLFSPHDDFHGGQIGGGSLWVPEQAVESPDQEEALIDFFLWITGPEPQAEWHKRTGYFPLHRESRDMLESDGFFEENPAWTAGFDQLEKSESSEYTRMHMVATTGEVGDERMDLWTALRQGEDLDEMLSEYKQRIGDALQR
ncbi:extracellular solute-binding protein [Halalkalirubrum salinum]|uniref:extracellular solute-binding protein n=1 Tax=Halalkalirubrum salinum TaxID=2563889 RepID=UPI0010FB28AD|nr:extracellular solute-binding protein [Halalkalirubrum salinum]